MRQARLFRPRTPGCGRSAGPEADVCLFHRPQPEVPKGLVRRWFVSPLHETRNGASGTADASVAATETRSPTVPFMSRRPKRDRGLRRQRGGSRGRPQRRSAPDQAFDSVSWFRAAPARGNSGGRRARGAAQQGRGREGGDGGLEVVVVCSRGSTRQAVGAAQALSPVADLASPAAALRGERRQPAGAPARGRERLEDVVAARAQGGELALGVVGELDPGEVEEAVEDLGAELGPPKLRRGIAGAEGSDLRLGAGRVVAAAPDARRRGGRVGVPPAQRAVQTDRPDAVTTREQVYMVGDGLRRRGAFGAGQSPAPAGPAGPLPVAPGEEGQANVSPRP
jgi:hypothetical protein